MERVSGCIQRARRLRKDVSFNTKQGINRGSRIHLLIASKASEVGLLYKRHIAVFTYARLLYIECTSLTASHLMHASVNTFAYHTGSSDDGVWPVEANDSVRQKNCCRSVAVGKYVA